MKVNCIATKLTEQQKKQLGLEITLNPQYPFIIGTTYTVLALSSKVGLNAGTILQIPGRYIIPAPLCLFEIVDERPSIYWKIKKRSDYELSLWPEEFYQEYFHDDLSEGVPEVVAIYNQVVERLEKEFD
jgi:hypothetical protein